MCMCGLCRVPWSAGFASTSTAPLQRRAPRSSRAWRPPPMRWSPCTGRRRPARTDGESAIRVASSACEAGAKDRLFAPPGRGPRTSPDGAGVMVFCESSGVGGLRRLEVFPRTVREHGHGQKGQSTSTGRGPYAATTSRGGKHRGARHTRRRNLIRTYTACTNAWEGQLGIQTMALGPTPASRYGWDGLRAGSACLCRHGGVGLVVWPVWWVPPPVV